MENTVASLLNRLHDRYRACHEGAVADYIPELTKADPEWFGISIFTTDGCGYAVGDAEQPFTIQSISKAFTYGMVLDAYGLEAVDRRIGVEPSGDAFNSISLDPVSGRPLNPMINAGAIAATGMVRGEGMADRFEKIRKRFSLYAGRELEVDEEVYASESATGFRNRAIAHLLRNFEMLDDPVEEAVEVYFKQCSILVTCRDLALMAATLANAGGNPVTGERALETENVERVLAVMSSCGMYDSSGEWIFRVGLPAKSGVGGGIVGVLPGQLGVAVFSPRLDAKGNSVRGVRTFAELSRHCNLHLFNYPVLSAQVIRRTYKLSEAGSMRERLRRQREAIARHGDEVTIIEMQGDLFFSAIERMLRVQSERDRETGTVVLDFTRVGLSDRATEALLYEFARGLVAAGRSLVMVDPKGLLDAGSFDALGKRVAVFDEIDAALEYCEDELLRRHLREPMVRGLFPFHDFELFEGIDTTGLSVIEGLLEMEGFRAGERIIAEGDEPDQIYLLAKGSVSVQQPAANGGSGRRRRVVSFSPGVSFGELALVESARRSADVWADESATCYTLPVAALRRLDAEHPAIRSRIIENILRINVDRLRRFNREIGALKA